MHDFFLAKEIIDELKKISQEKSLKKIKSVDIEIGQVALAHDGLDEHIDDVSIENLKFGLENMIKKTNFEGIRFNIKKIVGNNWKIVNIEV